MISFYLIPMYWAKIGQGVKSSGCKRNVILEFLVNVQSNFNQVIISSFQKIWKLPFNKRIINGSCFILVFICLLPGMHLKMQGRNRTLCVSSLCIFNLFCNGRIGLFIKIEAVWGIIRAGMVSYVVCHARIIRWIFIKKDIGKKADQLSSAFFIRIIG